MTPRSTANYNGKFLGLDAYRWAISAILFLAAAVFVPALKGEAIWDDVGFINGSTIGGGNSFLRCFTEPFNRAYYRPFVSASLYIDRNYLGNNTFYYHQTNVLLHVATVAAVIAIAAAAFRSKRISLLAGLLFAVQPLQVSTTAWIGGRTDSLCGLFVAVSILGIIRWFRDGKLPWLGVSVLSFFCAAMAKEQAVGLLPLFPLCAVAFRPAGQRLRTAAWLGVAYGIASAAFVVLWCLNYPNPFEVAVVPGQNRLVVFGETCWHYALLYFLPDRTRLFSYSLSNYDTLPVLWAVLGLSVFVASCLGCLALWRRSKVALWFAGLALLGFLPVSNIIPMPSLVVAPYRVGVAGIGVAILVAWAFDGLLGNSTKRRWVWAPIGAYLCYFAFLVGWAATQYSSGMHFFETVSKFDPGSVVVRMDLIQTQLSANLAEDAHRNSEQILDRVLIGTDWRNLDALPKLVKTDPRPLNKIATNQGNRVDATQVLGTLLTQYGTSLDQLGHRDKAIQAFEAAIKIEPRSSQAVTALAEVIYDTDKAKAVHMMHQALALNPDNTQAAGFLGKHYEKAGDWKLAGRFYVQAAEHLLWLGDLRVGAARAYMHLGRYDDALKQLALTKGSVVDPKSVSAVRAQILAARETRASRSK